MLFDKTQTLLLQYPAGKAGVAYTIPNTVTIIADSAFSWCLNLTNITIPSSVTNIGSSAFFECYYLTSVFFGGDAPWSVGSYLFDLIAGTSSATVFYLPGTAGWASMFAGRPTALWFLPNPLILSGPSFGIQTNRFGFVVSWATNLSVIVEGSTDLVHGSWSPLSTNALTNGSSYFSDPNWINHPTRFYRIRSP